MGLLDIMLLVHNEYFTVQSILVSQPKDMIQCLWHGVCTNMGHFLSDKGVPCMVILWKFNYE